MGKEKNINFLDIVENKWRTKYDREWGLALVLSTPNKGKCWIGFIAKDDKGYYLAPRNAYRHIGKLMETDKTIEDISLKIAT